MSLIEELTTDLTTELSIADENFNSTLLATKISNAVRQVKEKRKYPKTYSESQINADMEKYYSNIRDIALYDYSQVGAYGETSHSEDGISRNYKDRKKLFSGIVPIARF